MAKIPVLGQDKRLGPEGAEPARGSSQGQGAMDQSKKTMRHFYCRDVLWETFEQMANDFDCSIDYLINEAMRYYARSKNYNAGRRAAVVAGGARQQRGQCERAACGRRQQRRQRAPRARRRVRRCRRRRRRRRRGCVAGARRAPGAPGAGRRCRRRDRRGADAGAAQSARSRPSRRTAPSPALFLVFNNQRYPIDKDQFIIGRGSEDVAICRSRTATSRASTPR